MSTSRRSSVVLNNGVRRSPRRLRTKTPSVNELSKKCKNSPKGKRRLQFQNGKPLEGKKFYLDLEKYRGIASLARRLEQLGGKVEEFLSKDITFLVTNRKEADAGLSPRSNSTPSPGLSIPSPFPPANKSSSTRAWPSPLSVDSPQSVEQQKSAAKGALRGRALAHQATKKSTGSCNILTNARTWGVTIISLEKVEEKLKEYGSIKVDSKASSKSLHTYGKSQLRVKISKLQVPFLKVEDQSYQFKPLVQELKEWPAPNFDSPVGSCPFDSPKTVRELEKAKKSHKKEHKENKKPKKGYCECCRLHYDDLDMHLKSDHHQAFARNDSNYSALDSLIGQGPSLQDFLEKIKKKHQKSADNCNPERASEDNFVYHTPTKLPQDQEENGEKGEESIEKTKSKSNFKGETPVSTEAKHVNKEDNDVAGSIHERKMKESTKQSSGSSMMSSSEEKLESAEQKEAFEEIPATRVTRSRSLSSPVIAKACEMEVEQPAVTITEKLQSSLNKSTGEEPEESSVSEEGTPSMRATRSSSVSLPVAHQDHAELEAEQPVVSEEEEISVRVTRSRSLSSPMVVEEQHKLEIAQFSATSVKELHQSNESLKEDEELAGKDEVVLPEIVGNPDPEGAEKEEEAVEAITKSSQSQGSDSDKENKLTLIKEMNPQKQGKPRSRSYILKRLSEESSPRSAKSSRSKLQRGDRAGNAKKSGESSSSDRTESIELSVDDQQWEPIKSPKKSSNDGDDDLSTTETLSKASSRDSPVGNETLECSDEVRTARSLRPRKEHSSSPSGPRSSPRKQCVDLSGSPSEEQNGVKDKIASEGIAEDGTPAEIERPTRSLRSRKDNSKGSSQQSKYVPSSSSEEKGEVSDKIPNEAEEVVFPGEGRPSRSCRKHLNSPSSTRPRGQGKSLDSPSEKKQSVTAKYKASKNGKALHATPTKIKRVSFVESSPRSGPSFESCSSPEVYIPRRSVRGRNLDREMEEESGSSGGVDSSLVVETGFSPGKGLLDDASSDVSGFEESVTQTRTLTRQENESAMEGSVEKNNAGKKNDSNEKILAMFDSDDDEPFEGFEVPHFDQSFSSENDLSQQIDTIVGDISSGLDDTLVHEHNKEIPPVADTKISLSKIEYLDALHGGKDDDDDVFAADDDDDDDESVVADSTSGEYMEPPLTSPLSLVAFDFKRKSVDLDGFVNSPRKRRRTTSDQAYFPSASSSSGSSGEGHGGAGEDANSSLDEETRGTKTRSNKSKATSDRNKKQSHSRSAKTVQKSNDADAQSSDPDDSSETSHEADIPRRTRSSRSTGKDSTDDTGRTKSRLRKREERTAVRKESTKRKSRGNTSECEEEESSPRITRSTKRSRSDQADGDVSHDEDIPVTRRTRSRKGVVIGEAQSCSVTSESSSKRSQSDEVENNAIPVRKTRSQKVSVDDTENMSSEPAEGRSETRETRSRKQSRSQKDWNEKAVASDDSSVVFVEGNSRSARFSKRCSVRDVASVESTMVEPREATLGSSDNAAKKPRKRSKNNRKRESSTEDTPVQSAQRRKPNRNEESLESSEIATCEDSQATNKEEEKENTSYLDTTPRSKAISEVENLKIDGTFLAELSPDLLISLGVYMSIEERVKMRSRKALKETTEVVSQQSMSKAAKKTLKCRNENEHRRTVIESSSSATSHNSSETPKGKASRSRRASEKPLRARAASVSSTSSGTDHTRASRKSSHVEVKETPKRSVRKPSSVSSIKETTPMSKRDPEVEASPAVRLRSRSELSPPSSTPSQSSAQWIFKPGSFSSSTPANNKTRNGRRLPSVRERLSPKELKNTNHCLRPGDSFEFSTEDAYAFDED